MLESFSTILKLILENKLVLASIATANGFLHYGPILKSNFSLPALAEPWLQVNFGIGIFFSCLLFLGLLKTALRSAKDTFLFLKSVCSKWQSQYLITDFDLELLDFMYSIYPESIDIHRLRASSSDTKPADLKISLIQLVRSGYIHAPWQESYILTDLGLQKAKSLIESAKREKH